MCLDIFGSLSTVAGDFIDALVAVAGKITPIFWTAGAEGAAGTPTLYGYLLTAGVAMFVMSLGIGLVFRLYNYLRVKKGRRRYRR